MKFRPRDLIPRTWLVALSAIAPIVATAGNQDTQFVATPGHVFSPAAGKHTGRAGVESIPSNYAIQGQATEEPVASAPTRTSFIANWARVGEAKGYRLDVSTDPAFRTFLTGYQDLDVGGANGRAITGLRPGTTYYYRVRSYDSAGTSPNSGTQSVTTKSGAGLVISATFDSSITNNPNAAAIESTINQAVAVYESLFADPIDVSILFRYANTAPDGSPLGSGALAESDFVVYSMDWNSFISALTADATTSNDTTANNSLPGTALSANVAPSSANGRALGLGTAPAMFADGSLGDGGPFDGIVTLNSAAPFQFTRPTNSSNFDGLDAIEHEMDEIMGLGSYLNGGGTDLRPQDLFSWSSPGNRNVSGTGSRYFSINSGDTDIVGFNQDSSGDFGDWLSESCPQSHPYVQNAFACPGQSSGVTSTSPEGINLDVIGYDLVTPSPGSIPYGQVVTPSPGSTLASSSVTFTWDVGQATAFMFSIGDRGAGSSNIFNSGQTAANSVTVTLPTDGRILYVRLWSLVNGTWYNPPQDYTYTAEPLAVLTPTIAPGSGVFRRAVLVNIGTGTPGATIHYTLNGSNPTPNSIPFTRPFFVTGGRVIVKAIASKPGVPDSSIASANYTIRFGRQRAHRHPRFR
jgi:hypothetical protein